MLVKESLDGKRYEVLDKTREIKVFKGGQEINLDDIYDYDIEKKLDLERDLFEEGPNEIFNINGKDVEMNEFSFKGYIFQIYREIRIMSKEEPEIIFIPTWYKISSELDDKIRNYISNLDPNNFYLFEEGGGRTGEYRDDLPGFYEKHKYSINADAHLDEDGNVHLDGVIYVKRVR